MISVNNVSKTFGDYEVINDVSFDAKQGEILSVIGPSGCGKTTLLRIISGVLEPSQGEIKINSKNKDFGFVFQDHLLLNWLNLEENIALPLEIKGFTKKDKEEIVSRWIDFLGLKGFEKHYPRQLSEGMKQRVAIARAMSYDPQYILLDEPFASLDELNKEKLFLELLKIKNLGKTIIFVSHNLSEVAFLSDKVIVIGSGGKVKRKIAIKKLVPKRAGGLHSKKLVEVAKGIRNVIEQEW